MLQRLYDWTLRLAEHRYAVPALAIIAFVESSIFPIPPDVLLIPMILAARERAWWLAAICTFFSVLGGMAGWLIGFYLFDIIGQPILDLYGYADKFADFQGRYNEYGAWIVFIAGTTPFPYKVITIASGVTALSIPIFLTASVIARGLRFFILAGLLWYFGPPIRQFIEKRLGLMFTIFIILLVGGFVIAKYVI